MPRQTSSSKETVSVALDCPLVNYFLCVAPSHLQTCFLPCVQVSLGTPCTSFPPADLHFVFLPKIQEKQKANLPVLIHFPNSIHNCLLLPSEPHGRQAPFLQPLASVDSSSKHRGRLVHVRPPSAASRCSSLFFSLHLLSQLICAKRSRSAAQHHRIASLYAKGNVWKETLFVNHLHNAIDERTDSVASDEEANM